MSVDPRRHPRVTTAMTPGAAQTTTGGAAARLVGLPPNFPKVSNLEIARITPNPDQARRHFDQDAIISLAESIEKHGLAYPVLVEPLEDGFRLVGGERRYRAHLHLGRATIPAIVTNGDVEEISLIDNLQRVDLNVLEMAEAFQRTIDAKGYTYEELGQIVGRSKHDVTIIIAANKLADTIKAEYPAIAASVASRTLYEIAKLPNQADQLAMWARVKAGEGLADIRDAVMGRVAAAPRSTEPVRRVRDALRHTFRQFDLLAEHRAAMNDGHLDKIRDLRDRCNRLLEGSQHTAESGEG